MVNDFHKGSGACKTYHAIHSSERRARINYDFVILPILNVPEMSIDRFGHGDKIQFVDGEEKVIHDICLVKIDTSMFRNLCRLRYGVESRIVLHQWERNVMGLGYAPNVISEDYAAVVWFKWYEDKPIFMGGIR